MDEERERINKFRRVRLEVDGECVAGFYLPGTSSCISAIARLAQNYALAISKKLREFVIATQNFPSVDFVAPVVKLSLNGERRFRGPRRSHY